MPTAVGHAYIYMYERHAFDQGVCKHKCEAAVRGSDALVAGESSKGGGEDQLLL